MTARRSPGCLFVHVTLSLIPFFLPSFLPAEHREPDQQQFELESDIQIFQSVFYVYTRFLERGKFDNGLFIIAIETENETDRIAPEKKPGCPTVYPSETHRFLYNWPQNIMCTLNWMLIFTFPLFIRHLHYDLR